MSGEPPNPSRLDESATGAEEPLQGRKQNLCSQFNKSSDKTSYRCAQRSIKNYLFTRLFTVELFRIAKDWEAL